MRLKYYLRGLGIGIIGTAIILSFFLNGKEQVLSEDEIIQRAEKLGMVMQVEQEKAEEKAKENTGILQQIQENEEEKQEIAPSKEDISSKEESVKNTDNVVFVIDVNEGDDCLMVCQKIEAAGLVASAVEFKHYLFLNDLDTKISLGSHPIPKGAKMEEIAALLCEE